MRNPVETLALHALSNLPDSLSERRVILVAVNECIAADDSLKKQVCAALEWVDALNRTCASLSLSAARGSSFLQP